METEPDPQPCGSGNEGQRLQSFPSSRTTFFGKLTGGRLSKDWEECWEEEFLHCVLRDVTVGSLDRRTLSQWPDPLVFN